MNCFPALFARLAISCGPASPFGLRRTSFAGGLPSVALLRSLAIHARLRRAKDGADDQNRTGDLVLTKDALCQLSYIGLRAIRLMRAPADPAGRNKPPPCSSEGWSGRRGSNPRPTAWKAVTLPLSYSRLRARVASLASSAPPLKRPTPHRRAKRACRQTDSTANQQPSHARG